MSTMVNLEKMVELLSRVKFRTTPEGGMAKAGMRRARIVSRSDPAPRKGDKGRIVKITEGNVDFNRDMGKLRESVDLPPVGGPLPWGQWVAPDSPVVEHKGKYYFACIPTTGDTAGTCGVVCSSRYELPDGTPLEKHDELVQSIVYRKVDGTPLAKRDSSSDYGYRVFSLDRCSVRLTLDAETYEYTPQ
jgi:hypothetical protein